MFELGLFACVCKKGVFKGRYLRVLSDLHCLSLFSKAYVTFDCLLYKVNNSICLLAGSKEEAFFDSKPWLDSDCEDDFYSVNGGKNLIDALSHFVLQAYDFVPFFSSTCGCLFGFNLCASERGGRKYYSF